MENKPKTLFLNYSEEKIKQMKHYEELDAEFGYLNPAEYEYYFPSAPYDYDIVIANLDNKNLDKHKKKFSSIVVDRSDGEHLKNHIQKRGFFLGFIGECNDIGLRLVGLDKEIFLTSAEKRDNIFFKANHYTSEFDDIIKNIKPTLPLKKYISAQMFWKCLKSNRNKNCIASYRTTSLLEEEESQDKPSGLLLPLCKNRIGIIGDVINVLIHERTDLFPAAKPEKWLAEDRFTPAPILTINKKIKEKKIEIKKWMSNQQEVRKKIEQEYRHYQQILIADDNFKGDKKLSVNVKKVLEELGFEVKDIDEELKGTSGTRKEDYWVIDGDYFAVCEVSGTVRPNPKESLYRRVLQRINTIHNRKASVASLEKVTNVSGLLIANQDRKTHPDRRPKLYMGDQEEIVEAATDERISILSTVELYNIAIDVKEKRLEAKDARDIIKQGGRIEYVMKNNLKES